MSCIGGPQTYEKLSRRGCYAIDKAKTRRVPCSESQTLADIRYRAIYFHLGANPQSVDGLYLIVDGDFDDFYILVEHSLGECLRVVVSPGDRADV